jgi:lipopolysaccharide biosynthesis regulator YciM
MDKLTRAASAVLLAGAVLVLSGCAGSIERWIVDTRIHQGDVALGNGDVRDAELAYRLALKVDPSNARAQAGFVQAAAGLAQTEYARGMFDDALATIHDGLAVDADSVRLSALKTTIEAAKLRREIVVSNYPTYRDAGAQLQHAYEQLDATNKVLLRHLRRFSYTFDTDDLTAAIRQSYELQLDVTKNTNRLIVYRQLVNSGVPESETTATGSGSLLPLP